ASGARTAMLATFLSVGITLLVVLWRGRANPVFRKRNQIVGFCTAMFLFSAVILSTGVINEDIESIILKDEEVTDLAEAFVRARGASMEAHIENFLDAPFTGHGFGVYREGVRGGAGGVDRFMGIPISASAEKGVVFTAVLEEVGIFGALLFYALVISLIARAGSGLVPSALAMVTATIAVNFGEAIFFAAGGMGLYMWLLCGFALARVRQGQNLTQPRRRRRINR
ncbi:MAG: hypothetical protein AAF699_20755, partial [Pseudomonadota bacterium]